MTVTTVGTKEREILEALSKSMDEARIAAAAKVYESYRHSTSEIMGFSVSDLQVINTLMKELEMTPQDIITVLRKMVTEEEESEEYETLIKKR